VLVTALDARVRLGTHEGHRITFANMAFTDDPGVQPQAAAESAANIAKDLGIALERIGIKSIEGLSGMREYGTAIPGMGRLTRSVRETGSSRYHWLSHSIGYDKRPISSRFLARLGHALTYFVKPSILQISGCDGIRQSGFSRMCPCRGGRANSRFGSELSAMRNNEFFIKVLAPPNQE